MLFSLKIYTFAKNLKGGTMGKYSSQLENYFNTTPKEILDRDYKELECFNEVGISIYDFLEQALPSQNLIYNYSSILNPEYSLDSFINALAI